MVVEPGGICHRWQQDDPPDEPYNIKNEENASSWFRLRNEIGNIGEAHVVAECVHYERSDKVSGPNEEIRWVNAKYRCVEELEERDEDRRFLIHSRPETFDHVM